MNEDQPAPVIEENDPLVWPRVIAKIRAMRDRVEGIPRRHLLLHILMGDMLDRHEHGIRKFGVPLAANNGRDHRADLYRELLDACAYAEASYAVKPTIVWRQIADEAIRLAARVREAMGEASCPTR